MWRKHRGTSSPGDALECKHMLVRSHACYCDRLLLHVWRRHKFGSSSICMYACMYVCIYIYTHTSTYIHWLVYTQAFSFLKAITQDRVCTHKTKIGTWTLYTGKIIKYGRILCPHLWTSGARSPKSKLRWPQSAFDSYDIMRIIIFTTRREHSRHLYMVDTFCWLITDWLYAQTGTNLVPSCS